MKHYLIVIAVVILMINCSKSSDSMDNTLADCNSGSSLESVMSDEVAKLHVAYQSYSQDPSSANCENYKTVLKAYIKAIEKYKKCAIQFGTLEQWQQDKKIKQENLDQLQCQ